MHSRFKYNKVIHKWLYYRIIIWFTWKQITRTCPYALQLSLSPSNRTNSAQIQRLESAPCRLQCPLARKLRRISAEQ
jgi:hypothetical protein